MPIIQVSALYTILEYRRNRDDVYKWLNLPFWQSAQGLGKAEVLDIDSSRDQLRNPLLILFSTLTPALNAARWAGVRHERGLDALQTIEAIRLYAANHDGTLTTQPRRPRRPRPARPGHRPTVRVSYRERRHGHAQRPDPARRAGASHVGH